MQGIRLFATNCWEYLQENQLLVSIIIIIITALVTHMFEIERIKKKQDASFHAALGAKIVSAYLAVRDLELELKVYDAFEPSIDFAHKNNGKAEEFAYYPSFMNSRESISKYCERVSDARKKYDAFLSDKTSAYFNTLEKYLLELALFLGEHELWDYTEVLGIIFIKDVLAFQKDFDKLVVQEINHPRYTLESRTSQKYKKELAVLKAKYIDNSELMIIHNNREFLEMIHNGLPIEKHE